MLHSLRNITEFTRTHTQLDMFIRFCSAGVFTVCVCLLWVPVQCMIYINNFSGISIATLESAVFVLTTIVFFFVCFYICLQKKKKTQQTHHCNTWILLGIIIIRGTKLQFSWRTMFCVHNALCSHALLITLHNSPDPKISWRVYLSFTFFFQLS